MTREEAIQELTHELRVWENECKSAHPMKDALRMAIEALSAKPTIPTFAESAEAYKAWTGEEMGRPHGRLIDAEKLKIKIEEELYSNDYEEHIYQIIDNAPTVSADRPHGEWIDRTTYDSISHEWECSECGKYTIIHYNFCPYCGAKMGGDDE